MRIIAGKWKGRSLAGTAGRSTRPMSDKVRGALFNVVGDLSGKTVLDVYAGTGAVALEALSRGATLAEAIESERSAAKVIQKNAGSLGAGEDLVLTVAKAEKWLDWPANQAESRYNVIVADPPYRQLNPAVLSRLGGFLQPEGLLVVSHDSKLEPPELAGLSVVQAKRYGDSSLTFYNRS